MTLVWSLGVYKFEFNIEIPEKYMMRLAENIIKHAIAFPLN